MKLSGTFPFIIACVLSNDAFSQLHGHYSCKGKDFRYSLNLNSDSTFSFRKTYFESDSKCVGKWQKISTDTIFLKCFESPVTESLMGGYMNERELYVLIINKKRLRVGNVTMRRQ